MSLTGRDACRYPLLSLKSQTSNLQCAASRCLNPAHRRGLRSHPSLCDEIWGWVAETGLERPAYAQMPLRGNENAQTPESGRRAPALWGATNLWVVREQ